MLFAILGPILVTKKRIKLISHILSADDVNIILHQMSRIVHRLSLFYKKTVFKIANVSLILPLFSKRILL